MEISKTLDGGNVTLALKGRLDTVTSPQLAKELETAIGEATSLTLDFSGLEYVSSSGLRLILIGYKGMNAKGGRFALAHVNPDVMEVLNMTGFADLMTIE